MGKDDIVREIRKALAEQKDLRGRVEARVGAFVEAVVAEIGVPPNDVATNFEIRSHVQRVIDDFWAEIESWGDPESREEGRTR